MTTTTASVPRPRSLLFRTGEAAFIHFLLAALSLSLVFSGMCVWVTHEAMRETRELRVLCPSPGIIMMNAGPALVSDHTRIMLCDNETCRLSP